MLPPILVMSKKLIPKVKDIVDWLEKRAPAACAEPWDNVGLLVGNPEQEVKKIIVAVEFNDSLLREALRKKANVILLHHPVIFPKSKGINQLVDDGGMKSWIMQAVQNQIAILVCHTNFDRCALEVAQMVSEGLGIDLKGRLFDKKPDLYKLIVYVPFDYERKVYEALYLAGAGQIGQYDACSFSSQGKGRFRPLLGSKPFLGNAGKIEEVSETKLEMLLPVGLKNQVIRALKAAHPYQEIAYDLILIEQDAPLNGMVSGVGYGFWGEINSLKSFKDLIGRVRSTFNVKGFWEYTSPDYAGRLPKRVAFSAGKGSDFFEYARKLGCDLMVTGEAGYHEAQSCSRRSGRHKMRIWELGHRESELFFPRVILKWLKEESKAQNMDLKAQIWAELGQKWVS